MSFSVTRSQIEARKPSKKIGNLFSDAWKKGSEAKSQVGCYTVFVSCGVSQDLKVEATMHA